MKQILALVLIAAVNWHLFASVIVYASFKINQDHIAQYLCISKDDPASDCQGCCQLKKELQEQKDKKADLPGNQIKKVEIQYFVVSSSGLSPFASIHVKNKTQHQYPHHSFGMKDIFHPPQKVILIPAFKPAGRSIFQ